MSLVLPTCSTNSLILFFKLSKFGNYIGFCSKFLIKTFVVSIGPSPTLFSLKKYYVLEPITFTDVSSIFFFFTSLSIFKFQIFVFSFLFLILTFPFAHFYISSSSLDKSFSLGIWLYLANFLSLKCLPNSLGIISCLFLLLLKFIGINNDYWKI